MGPMLKRFGKEWICNAKNYVGSEKNYKITTVRSIVKTSLSVPEVWGSIPGSVKSDTASPTSHHRCDISSELSSPGAKPRR